MVDKWSWCLNRINDIISVLLIFKVLSLGNYPIIIVNHLIKASVTLLKAPWIMIRWDDNPTKHRIMLSKVIFNLFSCHLNQFFRIFNWIFIDRLYYHLEIVFDDCRVTLVDKNCFLQIGFHLFTNLFKFIKITHVLHLFCQTCSYSFTWFPILWYIRMFLRWNCKLMHNLHCFTHDNFSSEEQ